MDDASIKVMSLNESIYDENTGPMLSHLNVGAGVDCTIKELVEKVVGFGGDIGFDSTKPDGELRMLMNGTL